MVSTERSFWRRARRQLHLFLRVSLQVSCTKQIVPPCASAAAQPFHMGHVDRMRVQNVKMTSTSSRAASSITEMRICSTSLLSDLLPKAKTGSTQSRLRWLSNTAIDVMTPQFRRHRQLASRRWPIDEYELHSSEPLTRAARRTRACSRSPECTAPHYVRRVSQRSDR